ncbi:MAG: hypothetical protein ACUVXB_02735 [Bryobacteraceae bacterium]
MFGWLRRRKKPEPLIGGPVSPRVKTYSADSGYVYQYIYKGRRPECNEYVFEVTSDLKQYFSATVVVPEEVLRSWAEGHGRDLAATERYAVAKMALFQAFDERARPEQMKQAVHVRAADLEAILDRLGID